MVSKKTSLCIMLLGNRFIRFHSVSCINTELYLSVLIGVLWSSWQGSQGQFIKDLGCVASPLSFSMTAVIEPCICKLFDLFIYLISAIWMETLLGHAEVYRASERTDFVLMFWCIKWESNTTAQPDAMWQVSHDKQFVCPHWMWNRSVMWPSHNQSEHQGSHFFWPLNFHYLSRHLWWLNVFFLEIIEEIFIWLPSICKHASVKEIYIFMMILSIVIVILVLLQ